MHLLNIKAPHWTVKICVEYSALDALNRNTPASLNCQMTKINIQKKSEKYKISTQREFINIRISKLQMMILMRKSKLWPPL